MSVLSNNLKVLRNKQQLTQFELSKKLKLDRATYASYETGRTCPSIPTLINLADIFNVTVDQLIRKMD